MRRVTAKPPKMLMLASRIATNASAVIDGVAVPDLQQRADDDDAGDRVGHRHQRRVQRVVHVADHVVADHDRQREHREVPGSAAGRQRGRAGTAPRRRRRRCANRRAGDIGCFSAFDGDRRRRRRLRPGAAETCTGGGGQVISPSRDDGHRRAARRRRSPGRAAPSLPGRQQLHQVDQVGAVELRGLRGQPAGQVGVADDRDAVGGDDRLVRRRCPRRCRRWPRPCRRSRCPASSRRPSRAVISRGAGRPGISAVVMMMSTSLACSA